MYYVRNRMTGKYYSDSGLVSTKTLAKSFGKYTEAFAAARKLSSYYEVVSNFVDVSPSTYITVDLYIDYDYLKLLAWIPNFIVDKPTIKCYYSIVGFYFISLSGRNYENHKIQSQSENRKHWSLT